MLCTLWLGETGSAAVAACSNVDDVALEGEVEGVMGVVAAEVDVSTGAIAAVRNASRLDIRGTAAGAGNPGFWMTVLLVVRVLSATGPGADGGMVLAASFFHAVIQPNIEPRQPKSALAVVTMATMTARTVAVVAVGAGTNATMKVVASVEDAEQEDVGVGPETPESHVENWLGHAETPIAAAATNRGAIVIMTRTTK